MSAPVNTSAVILPAAYLQREKERNDLTTVKRTKNGLPMPRKGSIFIAYGMEWEVVKLFDGGRMQVRFLKVNE